MCGLIVEEVVNGWKINRMGKTNVIPRQLEKPAELRPEDASTSFPPQRTP